jgi:predicted DNA-binding transcriptional regulator AlpA
MSAASGKPGESRLLTVQQVARKYGVAVRTVWRWDKLGRIPRGKRLTTNTVRWHEDEINRHLDSLG